jgi:hypothetical protein
MLTREEDSLVLKCSYWLFTIEAGLKILAMGFILQQNSYMRSVWNFIDFIIVIASVIRLTGVGDKSSMAGVLQNCDALVPLKVISHFKKVKLVANPIISALKNLANVSLFLLFMFIIFSILGLQTFSGDLYSRCRTTQYPVNSTFWPIAEDLERTCSSTGFICPSGTFCGHPRDYGISLEDDKVWERAFIQYGVSSYDNFGQALLGVFQIITTDNWSMIMFNFMDGRDPYIATVFFQLNLLVGAFFLINMILAVIM